MKCWLKTWPNQFLENAKTYEKLLIFNVIFFVKHFSFQKSIGLLLTSRGTFLDRLRDSRLDFFLDPLRDPFLDPLADPLLDPLGDPFLDPIRDPLQQWYLFQCLDPFFRQCRLSLPTYFAKTFQVFNLFDNTFFFIIWPSVSTKAYSRKFRFWKV